MKHYELIMAPGIGLMKRRLEKEKDAIALAISGIAKKYDKKPEELKTLETKYHDDAGDWYVAPVSYTHLTLPTNREV